MSLVPQENKSSAPAFSLLAHTYASAVTFELFFRDYRGICFGVMSLRSLEKVHTYLEKIWVLEFPDETLESVISLIQTPLRILDIYQDVVEGMAEKQLTTVPP